ncbi:MAG: putative Diguanylate kinase, partial [Frankiales bacterium]|nr:putative Diguanylate kinase [Frankiales bacterium]
MPLPVRSAARRLLALAVSGGLVLLLGGLGLVAGWQASDRALDTHVADRLALQRTLGGLVEQYVRSTAGDLVSHTGRTPWPLQGAQDRLEGVVAGSLFVDSGAVLVDGLGRPLASWTPPGTTVPPADDPGWVALRQSVLARRLPVSGILTPGVAPVSAVGVPVPLADGTRGLVVGLSAARVTNLQGYVEGLHYGRTGQGWVVDSRGLALAGPDAQRVSRPLPPALLREVLGGRGSGTAVYDDAEGTSRFVSWDRAGATGWTALTVQDEQEFAGPLRSAGRRAQALVAALLLIAGTGLVVLHRKREVALERIAVRDHLTGLYNRGGWFHRADAELRRAARQGQERVLLFVDLDGLKQVNDVLGHREGDRAITAAARVLSAAARDGDLVGRLGGDEFVLLLGDDGH